MSSILKALKKLEAEKAQHEDGAGKNISREILRQQPENRKLVLWFWSAGILALAVIALLTTLLLRKPAQLPEVMHMPPSPATVQPVLPPEVTAAPASSGSGTVSAPPVTAVEQVRHQSGPLSPPPQQPVESRQIPELPAGRAPTAEPPRTDSGKKPVPLRAPEPADTALTLTGIAWNKDSADRLAIINGQPAATGATISGVVVEEIMPDRVRVNSAGRSFEIFLGKPAQTN